MQGQESVGFFDRNRHLLPKRYDSPVRDSPRVAIDHWQKVVGTRSIQVFFDDF